MAKLVAKEGVSKGTVFTLSGGRTSIGRDFSNVVQLSDTKVSRHHAVIEQDGDTWRVRDLDSRNGTRVNGLGIKEQVLKPLDTVEVGDVVLLFVQEIAGRGLQQEECEDSLTVSETIEAERIEALREGGFGRAEADISSSQRQMGGVLRLSAATSKVRALPELMDIVCEVMVDTLNAHRAVPMTLDEDSEELIPWFKEGGRFEKQMGKVPISTSIVDHVRRSKEAVLSHSTSDDERFVDSPSIQAYSISTAMCAPLLIGGKMLGVIYTDRLGSAEPFSHEDLELLTALAGQTALAVESIRLFEDMHRAKQTLQKEVRERYNIIGQSDVIAEVYDFIERAAPTNSSVLILGESGTGKELVARAIHYNSPLQDAAFETVNCAALTETLVESELFGHVKGAFTGANEDRHGRFELADGGSIFLDEIGELSEACQSKLLRVIEQGELRRVGDTKNRSVNVRVIAATNKDLADEVRGKKFREDLFYRLNVLSVSLPPLRERGDDIKLLANHFLHTFGEKCGKCFDQLPDDLMQIVLRYNWPGNVRELRNVIERMVVMSAGEVLTVDDLPPELSGESPGARDTAVPIVSLAEMEKQHILHILAHTGNNKKETAAILGIDRSTLYAKLKAYDIAK